MKKTARKQQNWGAVATHTILQFLVTAVETYSAMPINLPKWPSNVFGLFAADAKRTLELNTAHPAPSLD